MKVISCLLVFSVLATGCLIAGDLPLDPCQGYAAVQREATGHFRTEQIDGRWFLITPQGHPYITIGVNRCELLSWFKTAGNRPHWRQGILDPAGKPYPVKAAAVRETNRRVLEEIYRSIAPD